MHFPARPSSRLMLIPADVSQLRKYYNGVDQYVDWSDSAPARRHARPEDKPGDPDTLTTTTAAMGSSAKAYEARRHALFFTDAGARRLYKQHVATVLGRVNSINGRRYSHDPTILAWSLINEPRCESWLVAQCRQALQAWVEEMAAYVKSLDPRHLLTIGSEGATANHLAVWENITAFCRLRLWMSCLTCRSARHAHCLRLGVEESNAVSHVGSE